MSDLHVFEEAGQAFVFFPRSARLYQLSPAAARIVSQLSVRPEIPDASLTTALRAELSDLLTQEAEVALPSPASSVASRHDSFHTFSLYLAQTCNMSCCYCWNMGGSFGKGGDVMSTGDAKAVTRLITSLVASSAAREVSINFYGGEPLLNFPVLRQITLDLRKEQRRLGTTFHLALATNGSLLEGEVARFLAQHFSLVSVSVDGRMEVHDFQRPGKGGEGTWQRIAENIAAFRKPEILALRGTLTLVSDPYLETFRQLSAFGVRRIQLEYCHEPFRGDARYRRLVVPLERQLAELRQFVDDYIPGISRYNHGGMIPFVSNVLDHVRSFRRGDRYTRPCGAGINTLAINSHGDIFPCIAFVEQPHFKMGQVAGPAPLSLHDSLREFNVDGDPLCRCCWLRYDCGGGCYASHCDMTGSSCERHPEYCDAMRGKARIYLYAMALMQQKCPWLLSLPP